MTKRPLDRQERALWGRVTADVVPLAPGVGAKATLPVRTALPDLPVRAQRESMPKAKLQTSASPVFVPQSVRPRAEQAVTMAGDPRQMRHVRRGRREIDGTLDLHGMRQEQAFAALQNFLMMARARHDRTLLVITGKGARETIYAPFSMVTRGVLRHRFLEWVDGPFRAYIASVSPAHPRHGGSGAFYVLLKRG